MTRVTLTTANTPGAVAILQLHGECVADALQQLTGRSHWPDRRAMLVNLADIDEGLAIMLSGQVAQLMPHGGPRVVQRLLQHLTRQLGCTYDPAPDVRSLYPEATSAIEADMLNAIAHATSPAAIDLLAQQPAHWRSLLQQAGEPSKAQRQHIAQRSQTLNQLLTPPTVVVAGPANVGKSTLTNALMGKSVSIVADLPGTTRDWVGGLVELSQINDASQAVAVHWLDTPGLRDSDDAIEQRAIQLARQQLEHADVLIAMRDPDQPWPVASSLPRIPDLFVINKVDDAPKPDIAAGRSSDHPLAISAANSHNLGLLQSIIIEQLGLSQLTNEPWAFSESLQAWCASGDPDELRDYVD
ncbi:MAG: GTPase [Phycisphaeraceae bacterium]